MSSLVYFIISIFALNLGYDLNKAARSPEVELHKREFYGSLDTDDAGNLCFYHVPDGSVKPAVLFINKVSFVKRSDKLIAYKNIGKNVRIEAEFVDLNDFVILLIHKIDILELKGA